MDGNDVQAGLRIRTNRKGRLRTTQGFLIGPQYLAARRADAPGKVRAMVPGHGGDVWYIEHDDGTVAAYCYDEFVELVVVVVTERTSDFHAQIKGTEAWGCGATVKEAIGDLVFAHPEKFNVEVALAGVI